MTKQGIVYLVGIVILGLFYEPLKAATGGRIWFVLVVVGYLTILRVIGYGLAKCWPEQTNEQDN